MLLRLFIALLVINVHHVVVGVDHVVTSEGFNKILTKKYVHFFPKLVCFLFIFFFYIEGNELIICMDFFV
jgi:hypothetical protein